MQRRKVFLLVCLFVFRNSFIVLFCFSKKEPKKEPGKGLHPFAGGFPDWTFVLLCFSIYRLNNISYALLFSGTKKISASRLISTKHAFLLRFLQVDFSASLNILRGISIYNPCIPWSNSFSSPYGFQPTAYEVTRNLF